MKRNWTEITLLVHFYSLRVRKKRDLKTSISKCKANKACIICIATICSATTICIGCNSLLCFCEFQL